MSTGVSVKTSWFAPEAPPDDVWTLPTKPGAATPLVLPADYVEAARELSSPGCAVEAAAVYAVALVESSGSTGFDSAHWPLILYESPRFAEHTKHKYDAQYPILTAPYSADKTSQYKKNQLGDQWDLLRQAFALDKAAAVMSCSWGAFQVLGENAPGLDPRWSGPSGLRQFVEDMCESAAWHLHAFVDYCTSNHLAGHLARHEWGEFAGGYNGGDYADNSYDVQLRHNYSEFNATYPDAGG